MNTNLIMMIGKKQGADKKQINAICEWIFQIQWNLLGEFKLILDEIVVMNMVSCD